MIRGYHVDVGTIGHYSTGKDGKWGKKQLGVDSAGREQFETVKSALY